MKTITMSIHKWASERGQSYGIMGSALKHREVEPEPEPEAFMDAQGDLVSYMDPNPVEIYYEDGSRAFVSSHSYQPFIPNSMEAIKAFFQAHAIVKVIDQGYTPLSHLHYDSPTATALLLMKYDPTLKDAYILSRARFAHGIS